MNNEEIWKPIEGYEGLYEVSDCGNVRSLDREVRTKGNGNRIVKGKVLNSSLQSAGYLNVYLSNGKGKKHHFVHRLVAQAFLPNPNNLPQVNHKDEDKTNNKSSNLEWCTAEYNANYGTHNKRIAEKLSKKVYQYTKDNKLVKVYESASEAQRKGFHSGHITRCCLKRNGFISHKGFKWSYTPLETDIYDLN